MPCWTTQKYKSYLGRGATDYVLAYRPYAPEFSVLPSHGLERPTLHLLICHKLPHPVAHAYQRECRAAVESVCRPSLRYIRLEHSDFRSESSTQALDGDKPDMP